MLVTRQIKEGHHKGLKKWQARGYRSFLLYILRGSFALIEVYPCLQKVNFGFVTNAGASFISVSRDMGLLQGANGRKDLLCSLRKSVRFDRKTAQKRD